MTYYCSLASGSHTWYVIFCEGSTPWYRAQVPDDHQSWIRTMWTTHWNHSTAASRAGSWNLILQLENSCVYQIKCTPTLQREEAGALLCARFGHGQNQRVRRKTTKYNSPISHRHKKIRPAERNLCDTIPKTTKKPRSLQDDVQLSETTRGSRHTGSCFTHLNQICCAFSLRTRRCVIKCMRAAVTQELGVCHIQGNTEESKGAP